MTTTITALLSAQNPDATALSAPDRGDLSYGALAVQTDAVRAALHGAGIGRGDRVAIVMPNGPEMAAAILCIGQVAVTAPLNPAYGAPEFRFYLEDLGAKALVVARGDDQPALQVAREIDLPVIFLDPDTGGPAGAFTLTPEQSAKATDTSAPEPGDAGLILHTSGTTSRPKVVPLSQANLAASAGHIATSLALTPEDRCLNMMPLFHIHGLVAALLASLSSGGAVSCTPGFSALSFFPWLKAQDPTWYTAVPTMHQAILARAPRNAEISEACRLRFLRSSSASLPGPVMEALAETFGAPVIEAYGMTEAAHQMTCNPLGAGLQRPGSVGVAAGPEVAIAHEAENHITGGVGEVVISGPNVTAGYENNPEANEKNFFEADGKRWFRTGDQGEIDAKGYLTLTGRLKEIINRGGEKISPLEVDGVLSAHPAVAQAVTFALPHDKLGEDVAAAVVLKEGQEADEKAIRAFVGEQLAAFKVPRKVLILDEIPKGATGKLQRICLAEKLGLVEGAA